MALLLPRLLAEAADDTSAIFGAAFGEGRYAAMLRSKGSVLAQALQKPPSELTMADARSFACGEAYLATFAPRGTKPFAAAGFANPEQWFSVFMYEEWFAK